MSNRVQLSSVGSRVSRAALTSRSVALWVASRNGQDAARSPASPVASPVTAKLPLRKGAPVQQHIMPAEIPDLLRDSEVVVHAAPEIDYGLKSLEPCLTASLAPRFDWGWLKGARLIGTLDDRPFVSSLNLQLTSRSSPRRGRLPDDVDP